MAVKRNRKPTGDKNRMTGVCFVRGLETANTESKNAALNFLRTRVSEVSSGKVIDQNKITVQSLADSMTKAWELGQKNEATQEWAARC